VGFVSSGLLRPIIRGYQAFGNVLGWALIAAVAIYLAVQIRMWNKARAWRSVPFVSPAEAAREVAAGVAVIYDVRSHGYYDANTKRIQGSRRLDPNALHQFKPEDPTEKLVFLYCTCVREATSARVAHTLLKDGVHCAVIKGGLRAWRKAGLPLEPVPAEEIAALPAFDR